MAESKPVVCRRIWTSIGIILLLRTNTADAWLLSASTSRFSRPTIHATRRTEGSFDVSPYWNDEDDFERPSDEYVEDDYDTLDRDVMEWESCPTEAGNAHVLLPPPSVALPSCIIHFTGGTLFGSAPNLWYRQLLEDIVRHTQSAVVASSIPVTLLQSPLQHVSLGKKIQRQFQTAWREVLLDEYGEDLENVPVCGMGHSLGARLMVVLATLGPPKAKPYIPPNYKSYILMSFVNNDAAAGIPGLGQLHQASRRVEKEATVAEESGRSSSRQPRRRRDDWDDGYDDDDDEWGEIFDEFQSMVGAQAQRIRNALTPSSQELEFYPTPGQLWKALRQDGRYNVPQTLIVQFDDDKVDQSAQLATAIVHSSDVKYARLRGIHLTPVSTSGREKKDWLEQVNSRVGRIVYKMLSGRSNSRSSEDSFLDLRRSIARYVTEIVTKD